GSTLKPFAFAMAFDQGKLARDTPLADEPLAFAGYVPSNFDNTFSRRVAAGDALVRSLNIPALHVLLMVGQPAFHRLLTGLGLTTLTRPAAHYGVGIVNGNAPVTLVELANAYALFGRGGKHLPLATTPGLASEPRAVFSPETARLVTDILSGPERAADATGHVADVELPRFAWKTGTSSGYRDAWAIAWNGQYVIGVWGGHRDGGNKNDGRVIGRRVATGRAWDVIRGIENQHSDFRTQNTEFRIQNGESFSAISHQPSALRIISPAPGTVFVVSDAHPVAMQKIAIRTYCEDAVVLHWFLDGVFQATQPSYAPLLFEPVPGAHVFTCTTDAGDFASVRIVVK
ncbi:MAG: penicillin-binding transpeptidase domain-containing protein, partial [Kiritimatiellaeota bacterium]|nr:penicillin-binding transpeptidase domain-containing protein [Kiritimatiellota bacterium]